MKFSLEKTYKFIPKTFSNDQAKEKEQISFTMTVPTFLTKNLINDRRKDGKDTGDNELIDSVFKHFVQEIHNIEIEEEEQVTKITKANWKKLKEKPGFVGLLNEVALETYNLMNGKHLDPLLSSSKPDLGGTKQ